MSEDWSRIKGEMKASICKFFFQLWSQETLSKARMTMFCSNVRGLEKLVDKFLGQFFGARRRVGPSNNWWWSEWQLRLCWPHFQTGKMTKRSKKTQPSPSDINRKERKVRDATNRELVKKFAAYRKSVGGSFNTPRVQ
jgi:hypothetical protein